jgi:hypothetical protein
VAVDGSKVTASFNNGLLTITLPKTPAAKGTGVASGHCRCLEEVAVKSAVGVEGRHPAASSRRQFSGDTEVFHERGQDRSGHRTTG